MNRFNLGLITTSGSLGLLFAPSLPLILYGIIAEQSIDDLFVAGILPGLLMIFLLSQSIAFAKVDSWAPRATRQPFDRREALGGGARVDVGDPTPYHRSWWGL